MNKRLAWSQIRDFFEGHWIELVDVEWNENATFPTRARVRNYAAERTTLIENIAGDREVNDAIILYVGHMSPLIEIDSKHALL
jgi:hypothetical protein